MWMGDKDRETQRDRRATVMVRTQREAERVKCIQGKQRGRHRQGKREIPLGYAFFKSLTVGIQSLPCLLLSL